MYIVQMYTDSLQILYTINMLGYSGKSAVGKWRGSGYREGMGEKIEGESGKIWVGMGE